MNTSSLSPPDTPNLPAAEPAPESADREKPFLVLNLRAFPQPNGSFVPMALVCLTPALRTSGLLLALPPDDLQALLFVLSFLHPNGHCQPSVFELAKAMALSPGVVRRRMRRLSAFLWHGHPLLLALPRDQGPEAYAPSPHLLAHLVEAAPESKERPPIRAAGRDAVIAHSRAAHARSRSEVEREIEAALGHASAPQDAETTALLGTLRAHGIPREQAAELMACRSQEQIRQQIAWLPFRRANNPAGMLVAAILNSYEEPAVLRRPHRADSPEVDK